MGKLYILCGIPGSGKSTWCKNNLKEGDKYISRDEIRFSLIKEDEDYFSKEKQVFDEYCRQISDAIEDGFDVYADATQINEKSRDKLLNKIKVEPDEINLIYLKVSLKTALERNSLRSGRECVPDNVIKNMYNTIFIDLNNYRIKNFIIINND